MQNQPKLFLNMIVKDSEPVEMVKRSLDSVKDYIDDIYITVTYNEEEPKDSDLIKLLKEYKVKLSFYKWNMSFADARNYAMDQVPAGKFNFIYWQDADDVLDYPEQLKPIVVDMIANNHSASFFNYWYQVELDDKGNVSEILIEHKRERIIRHDGTFKWVGMLHETLIEQKQEGVIKVMRPECTVVHLSTPQRLDVNIDRNIKILEKQAEIEQHKDPRTLMYLAKAYVDKGNFLESTQKKIFFDLALVLFNEYLEGSGDVGKEGYIEGSGWPEERATAWQYMAEIARQSGKLSTAIKALHNAIIEDATNPMFYIDLAMTYTLIKDFKSAKHWLMLATNVKQPETTLIVTPRDLKTKALEVDYNIALAEMDLPRAVKDSEMLCEILPAVTPLKERLEIVRGLLESNKASQAIVFLGKYLEKINEKEKLPYLVQSIPSDLQQEQFAAQMRHEFYPPRTWRNDEIAIVCGPGFEEWSPKSIQSGIGGSEEAVIYLSQELKRLGWKVTVFANPGREVGDHNGVNYRPWYEFNFKDQFNVVVLWRNIAAVDMNLQAKYKIVWLHDVPSNPDFTEERVNKVDKIAVLSEYHKSLLRMNKNGEFVKIPDEKIFLTSNGIIPGEINKKWKRNPKKMIYMSSPDRGLVYLLNNWPLIKKAVPEAELEILYGFQIYDAIHGNNPARSRWKQQVLDMMKQDGITYSGRIGHNELNKKLAEAGIWSYPTDFTEISCISAMKAQAMGAVPVVTNFAALKETVKNGVRVDINIQSHNGQQEYIKALIDMLNNTEKQEEIRPMMMKFARDNFTWSKVAESWNELIENLKGGDKNGSV